MNEEPYRWLEAMANRREYVVDQIKSGSPVFAVSLPEGILLAGVGSGQSKVFEIFDRHALAGLGHPADLEKIRQAAIDAAHLEGFNRAPEDVSLRRLVSFGLSPQLKTHFEQIFSAPILVELILAELGPQSGSDQFFRLHFDGAFELRMGGLVVAASTREKEQALEEWLRGKLSGNPSRKEVAEKCLEAWWLAQENRLAAPPAESERSAGWRKATTGKVVELGWLSRKASRVVRYQPLTLESL